MTNGRLQRQAGVEMLREAWTGSFVQVACMPQICSARRLEHSGERPSSGSLQVQVTCGELGSLQVQRESSHRFPVVAHLTILEKN